LLSPEQADRLRVVLVATRNPLNIGAAARAMSNFGFLRLRVVRPYDLAFREARSAVGAPGLLREAQVCSSLAEAVADCSLVVGTTSVGARELEHRVLRLAEGGSVLHDHLAAQPAALLFGSEKRGLSNGDLSHCHWLLRIPTHDEHHSMNLGQAVAVCLYELIRDEEQPAGPAPEPAPGATGDDLSRLEQALLEGLARSGYTKPGSEAATEEKARRLIRRLHLTGNDATTLTGMIAKMNHRRD
jgi:tRNA/rRNA methyltransferase